MDENVGEESRKLFARPQDFLSFQQGGIWAMSRVLTQVAQEGKMEETGLVWLKGKWPVGKMSWPLKYPHSFPLSQAPGA